MTTLKMALAWPSRFNFTYRGVYVKHLLHWPVEITAVLKASFPVVWYKILFGSPKGLLIEICCGYIRNFCVFLLLYSDIWTCLYLYDKPEVRLLQRTLEYFKWRMNFFLQIFNICTYICFFNNFILLKFMKRAFQHVFRNIDICRMGYTCPMVSKLFDLFICLVGLKIRCPGIFETSLLAREISNIHITLKDKGLRYLNYSCCLTTSSSLLCARFYYENIWLEQEDFYINHIQRLMCQYKLKLM